MPMDSALEKKKNFFFEKVMVSAKKGPFFKMFSCAFFNTVGSFYPMDLKIGALERL